MHRLVIIFVLLAVCLGVMFRAGSDVAVPGDLHASSATEESLSADEQLLARASPLPSRREISSLTPLPKIPFKNVTVESGIVFAHDRGLTDERLLPETFGSGCAVIDLNSDDLSDLVFINSKPWEWSEESSAGTSMLSAWLNLGGMQFRDVTKQYGLNLSLYGMGAAVADFDNDGDDDLYVTAVGRNILLRNDGDSFTDISQASGTAGPEASWGTSASWLDFDNDGDLDLFVANYVQWTPELERIVDAVTFSGAPRFGSPDAYPGTVPQFYRNDGEGVFTEIGAAAGLTDATKSLGIALLDIDDDHFIDIFVANDGVADQLWKNSGSSTFEDIAFISGVALSDTGAARAGMGVDIACFRNDGTHAIAVGQYENEMTALFVSDENDPKMFCDDAIASGLGRDSLADLTWGIRWADFDLDGRLDLLTINGHTEQSDQHMFRPGQYLQEPQIYWNGGPESARELIPLSENERGKDLFERISGRSLAVADLDNDGDLDIVTASSGATAQVLRNDLVTEDRHWLQIELIGKSANRSAIGSTIDVIANGVTQSRLVSSSRGYLSSSPLVQTFGLGTSAAVETATVTWPDGSQQQLTLSQITTNQRHTVHQESHLQLHSAQQENTK